MFATMPNLPPSLQPSDAFTRFAGGLDLETPAWSALAGSVRDALNYEIGIEDGYQDITGYERFDGRPKPSAASFMILDVTISGSIVVGDTVTGAVTGDTGYVIAVDTYPDDPTQYYLVLTKVVGDFDDDDEDLEVSATVEGNVDAVGYEDSSPTDERTAIYKNLAADQYRADITTVPGEGDVWGVFSIGNSVYAIRNAAGGATAVMHLATSGGWSTVDLGYELAFTSGGTTEIAEGDTITGLISGTTADVRRVVLTSGTWAGGDAAGYLYLDTPSAAFQAENIGNDGASDHATIAGDATAITLQPDGLLDYDKSNFADPQGPKRVYGSDGVNFGWEFDGTAFVRIRTGMTDDTPDHVIVHKNHLFFSFAGSVQHSAITDPYSWSPVLGAAEIAPGDTVTGFQTLPGAEGNAALLVATRQQNHILYGNDSGDWNLIPYRNQIGAYEWTIQQVVHTLFLDDRGITDLQSTQRFGNFIHSALSNRIRRLIKEKKSLAVASCIVRDKSQYRLFFSDETAIYVTMDGDQIKGMMPILLDDQVVTICSEEDASGNEQIFFGCDDGYVYQMEKGTSFDGDTINAYLYLHFDNGRQLEVNKGYFGPISIEGRATAYAEFDVSYQLDYNRIEVPQPDSQTAEVPGAEGSTWDSGLMWDTFVVWDNTSLVPSIGLELEGEGRNISWIITKNSDYFAPVLLTGIHYRYIPRVQVRS